MLNIFTDTHWARYWVQPRTALPWILDSLMHLITIDKSLINTQARRKNPNWHEPFVIDPGTETGAQWCGQRVRPCHKVIRKSRWESRVWAVIEFLRFIDFYAHMKSVCVHVDVWTGKETRATCVVLWTLNSTPRLDIWRHIVRCYSQCKTQNIKKKHIVTSWLGVS